MFDFVLVTIIYIPFFSSHFHIVRVCVTLIKFLFFVIRFSHDFSILIMLFKNFHVPYFLKKCSTIRLIFERFLITFLKIHATYRLYSEAGSPPVSDSTAPVRASRCRVLRQSSLALRQRRSWSA